MPNFVSNLELLEQLTDELTIVTPEQLGYSERESQGRHPRSDAG